MRVHLSQTSNFIYTTCTIIYILFCVCVQICLHLFMFPTFGLFDEHPHTQKTQLKHTDSVLACQSSFDNNVLQSISFLLHPRFSLCLLSNAVASLRNLRWLPGQLRLVPSETFLAQIVCAPLRDERPGHFSIF